MRLLYLLPLLALAACATVTKGSDEEISVATSPTGAACNLKNDAGAWHIEATPGYAIIKRDYSPLTIQCEHKNGSAASTTLEPATRGRAYGNILIGGVPALVDAKTGAGYDYAPANVTLTLKPKP